eukprot:12927589-Ditylum_brightwellii.AAC.1
MKLALSNLERAKQMMTSKLPPIPFFVLEKTDIMIPLDCQVYKLHTKPRDEKSAVYLLVVGFCMFTKKQHIMDFDVAYTLAKGLLNGNALQGFYNKERNHTEKSSPAFM